MMSICNDCNVYYVLSNAMVEPNKQMFLGRTPDCPLLFCIEDKLTGYDDYLPGRACSPLLYHSTALGRWAALYNINHQLFLVQH